MLKMKEINALRKADQRLQIAKENAMHNDFKLKVLKKFHQYDSTQRDIRQNIKIMHSTG